MKCPNCGTENDEGMKFCGECGTPLPQEKKCPNCGDIVSPKMKFCGNCGCRIDGAASGGNVNGLSMGDKNVVAGDVIGEKAEYKVSGNATIVHNEDESKKVLSCAICGKHLLNKDAITCSVCGKIVCAEHFDRFHSRCTDCAKSNMANVAQEYNDALKRAYSDGRVDVAERNELNAIMERLGLSKSDADSLEEKFLETFVMPQEQTVVKQAESIFLSGDAATAFKKLDPFYERLCTDEEFISLYLRCLKTQNPHKAIEIIKSFNADFEAALEVEAYICIAEGKLGEAEKIVDKMKRYFPDNVTTKCTEIFYLCGLYSQSREKSVLTKIKSLESSLQNPKTPYERKLIEAAQKARK